MLVPAIVFLLTALAAVVVVLTRVRLAGGVGEQRVGRAVLYLHTGAGALAVLLWLVFLLFDEESPLGSSLVGILALFCWWLTALAGLLILMRWFPSRGRHVAEAAADAWAEGPWLSVLAHVGMVVGVIVFTLAYLTSAV